MTRYSAKTKEELIWKIWCDRNPDADHWRAQLLYKSSINLNLPMTSIIEALTIYEGPGTSQCASEVEESHD